MSLPEPPKAFQSGTLVHFQTFVWLRWRIRINQLRNSSGIGKALSAILLVSFAISCVVLLVAGSVMGIVLPRLVPREYYFLFWDGLISLFCFIWMIFVATDVQRTDAITFDRILHLPVSFSQAFAINYLSSLINLPLISLCAYSSGFILGSCFSIGPIALVFIVPFCAFLIAITALTYQLQGWLAALMANPRRRQLVMIAIPLCIIILSQLPSFFALRFANEDAKRISKEQEARVAETKRATELQPTAPSVVATSENPASENPASENADENSDKLDHSKDSIDQEANKRVDIVDADQTTVEVNSEQLKAIQEEESKVLRERDRAAVTALWVSRLRQANLLVPPLWLAGCVESILEGTLHVFWLTGGMALIAFASLRRNYGQTLRYYKGETDSRAAATYGFSSATSDQIARNAIAASMKNGHQRLLLVERKFPLVSEETSAIIAMTLKSMTRAPEVKLYLLLPFLVPFLLFGVLKSWKLPEIDELKAAIVIGFSACCLFITSGLLGNVFAYDRAGFRAFVLSPIRRDRILLGRNLATFPFLFLQTLLMALAMGLFFGLSFDKFLCAVILSASILLPFSLLTNVMAILTPFPLAAGSIQPKQFNLVPILCSFALSMLMPVMMGIVLLPLGFEWLLDRFFESTSFIPIALILSIPWLLGFWFLYRWLLPWEGKLLASREKELLRIVTSKIE
jgi:ABC-2 type transport system permease protein